MKDSKTLNFFLIKKKQITIGKMKTKNLFKKAHPSHWIDLLYGYKAGQGKGGG